MAVIRYEETECIRSTHFEETAILARDSGMYSCLLERSYVFIFSLSPVACACCLEDW